MTTWKDSVKLPAFDSSADPLLRAGSVWMVPGWGRWEGVSSRERAPVLGGVSQPTPVTENARHQLVVRLENCGLIPFWSTRLTYVIVGTRVHFETHEPARLWGSSHEARYVVVRDSTRMDSRFPRCSCPSLLRLR